ncbi:hypothetical protein, partial [Paenarthrobacter sp. CM16]|uniref:hypothetical protein n=1 Tax=Paenarthrobacter sp. CM16 TaxID=2738447 RepID=UPI001C12EED5
MLSRSYRPALPPHRRLGRLTAVVLTTAALTATAVLPAGAAPASKDADPAALHSLRGGVSDQNFYFVMADRF